VPRKTSLVVKAGKVPGSESPDLSSLQNKGFSILRPAQLEMAADDEAKTLVVLGSGRGGTSAVAGMLSALGVSLGPYAAAPVFEDLELALAIEVGGEAVARDVIAARNRDYPVWGFKRPGFCRHVQDYHPCLRNPRYVVIYRDALAIAMRSMLSANADLFDALKSAYADYSHIQTFLTENKVPALLISYEKLIENPLAIAEQLAAFCGLAPEATARAAASVQRAPESYLDASRTTKSRGRLDIVSDRKVMGWAQYLSDRRPASVLLLVNGREVARVEADRFRQDLQDMGISADGCCAFEIELDTPLQPGDQLRVFATEDVFEVMNSPFEYGGDLDKPAMGLPARLRALSRKLLRLPALLRKGSTS
jgi:hypothetical protein